MKLGENKDVWLYIRPYIILSNFRLFVNGSQRLKVTEFKKTEVQSVHPVDNTSTTQLWLKLRSEAAG